MTDLRLCGFGQTVQAGVLGGGLGVFCFKYLCFSRGASRRGSRRWWTKYL